MNTSTSNIDNASGRKSASAVRGMFRTIRAEMRRALDLAIAAYGQGFAPPM